MTTKLTLTIEEEVIKTAKKYAQKKGRSLSGLVENYLKALASEDQPGAETSARVRRLRGSIRLPLDFDYESAVAEGIAAKHGK
jgi:hypothetical protein